MNNLETENIKKFLLGRLDDEAVWQSIEQRLLDDLNFAEEVEICEDELIDEYLSDTLTAENKIAFEQHFLLSPELRERLYFAKALHAVVADKKPVAEPRSLVGDTVKKPFFNFKFPQIVPVLAVATLIFVAALGASLYLLVTRESDLDKGLTALQRTYGNKRPFEARIVGFNHAPLRVTRGAESDSTKETSEERDRVERLLLDAVSARKDAASFYALGKFYLAEKNFDKALAQFEKAVRLSANDAHLHSDLGAALLEAAKQIREQNDGGKSLELFGRSLEYSDKAIQIDAQMLEPRFNRALCLQQMHAVNTAREAWREYLQLDSDSPWADEARRNLEQLEQRKSINKSGSELIQDFLAAFRQNDKETAWAIQSRHKEMITGKLIPQQLAKLFLESAENEKTEYLNAFKFSAALEAEKNDFYYVEIAHFYSALTPEKQTILLEAQTKINHGYELILQFKTVAAHEEFTAARSLFEKAGNHWEAGLTDYWIAFTDFELVQIEKSHQRLLKLAEYCDEKNYKWLCSQTYNWLAITANSRREHSSSIAHAKKSLELSEQLEDAYLSEKTLSWLAEKKSRVGQYRQGLNYIDQALKLASQPEAAPRQKSRDFGAATNFFYFLGRYHEALAYAQEWRYLSQQKPYNPSAERVSNAVSGIVLGAMKRYDEAMPYIERILALAAAESDERMRLKGRSFALLKLAAIERGRGNCQKALGHYEETIQILSAINFEAHLYEAHEGRLKCSLDNSDEAATREAIASAIRLLEDNRSKIREEQTRNSFFDEQQTVYDIAADYEFKRANHEASFNHLEMSRSRSLLDLKSSGAQLTINQNAPQIVFDENIAKPLTLRELRPQIPADVQIVQYAVLSDKILIWLISQDKFEALSYSINSDVLKNKTFDFVAALKKADDDLTVKGVELNRILFEQLEGKLDKNKTVCFIPDKFLFHLPFAALVSEENNRYLIENYQILTAPSLNIFLLSSQNAARRHDGSEQEKLLSIGNPAFNKQEFSSLTNLPAAEAEAAEIADLYRNKTVLLGVNATKSKIVGELPQADVVHFAGHYVANEGSPLLSSFPVAGEKETGVLTNFEILQQNLAKPRLIILSACQTEMEGYFNGEGIIGAGRTFLAAGVPLLVASQWQVETESTAALMKKFHRLRKTEKMTTVAALQRAQREMLEDGGKTFRHPYYWAGFTVLGGHAQF